jgi:hypothetical protein
MDVDVQAFEQAGIGNTNIINFISSYKYLITIGPAFQILFFQNP